MEYGVKSIGVKINFYSEVKVKRKKERKRLDNGLNYITKQPLGLSSLNMVVSFSSTALGLGTA